MTTELSALTFYVMRRIGGDECALFHESTLEAAKTRVIEQPAHVRDRLSIWTNRGGMVAWLHRDQWQFNKTVLNNLGVMQS